MVGKNELVFFLGGRRVVGLKFMVKVPGPPRDRSRRLNRGKTGGSSLPTPTVTLQPDTQVVGDVGSYRCLPFGPVHPR